MMSFKDISWQVTEKEYRADPALSYSTIARYEREGFNNLSKLFDKIESPSLTFGSCVDSIITGGEEEFNERFMIAQIDNLPSDTLVIITKRLFNAFKDIYHNLIDIPEAAILNTIEDIQWNNHWLPKTRVKKIKEDCAEYYSLLYLAGDKTIISTATYNDVINAVNSLKSSPATKFFFEPNNLFDDRIERFFQLKFKATFEGVDYRCMADEIVILKEKKVVIPVDLKTSSHTEWDFYQSFVDWSYMIQARLYWRIIRANMNKDPYFKDFELAPYKFIVVNKKTLTPLVWNYEDTKETGTLTYGKNNQIICRDPFIIGKELKEYLDNIHKVPNGISLDKPNSLKEWLNTI